MNTRTPALYLLLLLAACLLQSTASAVDPKFNVIVEDKAFHVTGADFATGVTPGDVPTVMSVTATGQLNVNGESISPTYTVSSNGLTPTAATNVMVIESGATKSVRLKRLIIQPGTATAAGIATLTVSRNTVAATAAGTAVSGATMKRVTTEANFSGIARVGAFTVVGVTSTDTTFAIPIPTPISSATNPSQPIVIDFTAGGNLQGFKIPVGATNGLMFKHSGLSGAANFGILAEFTEE